MTFRTLNSNKGALLFETFVALMILSIGITQSLSVFSQTLFAKKRNTAASEVQQGLDQLLFEWYAVPGAKIVNGTPISSRYKPQESNNEYTYKMSPILLPGIQDAQKRILPTAASTRSESETVSVPTAAQAIKLMIGGKMVTYQRAKENAKDETIVEKPGEGISSDKNIEPPASSVPPPATGSIIRQFHDVTIQATDSKGRKMAELETILFSGVK